LIEVDQVGDVVRIKLSREDGGRALYWTAVYLLDDVLIDTGCAYTVDDLLGFLDGRTVRAAVNTHSHEDHVAGNRALQERFGCEVFAHPAAVPVIARVPLLQPYRELVWGYPEPAVVNPLGPTVETGRFRLEVVDTPGHSQDHVAFVERDRGWCFSGDLFVGPRPKAVRPDEDVAAMVRSMERLAALETGTGDLVLFTGLGKVVDDGRGALLECAAYLRDLARRVRELARSGRTPPEIRDELFGGESVLDRLTDGHYSAENMVRALLASNLHP
jgi:glyoxylase-like metal-dependent hydrolase (beta-lactamase superfamily II)